MRDHQPAVSGRSTLPVEGPLGDPPVGFLPSEGLGPLGEAGEGESPVVGVVGLEPDGELGDTGVVPPGVEPLPDPPEDPPKGFCTGIGLGPV